MYFSQMKNDAERQTYYFQYHGGRPDNMGIANHKVYDGLRIALPGPESQQGYWDVFMNF
jgi:hypothetical protein